MVNERTIRIGTATIGGGAPCFVIAEAGVNHNGSLELAHKLVDAAADAGADAVKFQTFDPAALAAVDAPKAEYQHRGDDATSQRAMLEKLALAPEAYVALKSHAEQRSLVFLSSPFDERSADLLDAIGVPAFKIPSGEVTNHPFLRHVARMGKPMLVSTGMCDLEDVRGALDAVRGSQVALFHCVSSYPAAPATANLRAIETLRQEFAVPTGWSDHTMGIEIAVAAAARGAELIEKHITLDCNLPGPDHRASLETDEFLRMMRSIRLVETALGTGAKQPDPAERDVASVARKSLHYRAALEAGTRLGAEHLIALRPGTGLSPALLERVVGRTLRSAVPVGAMVREADLVEVSE